MIRWTITVVVLCLACGASAQQFSGTYTLQTDDGTARLKMERRGNAVSGSVSLGDTTATFSGTAASGRVTGTLTAPGSDTKASFIILPEGSRMLFAYTLLDQDGKPIPGASRTMPFEAEKQSPPKPADPATTKTPAKPTSVHAAPGGPVRINGVIVPTAEVDRLAKKYGQRIPVGDWWYDGKTGAWGKQGGPTLGFTLSGLSVGGKLKANASGGHTGVFVNGRELHAIDVNSLMRAGIPVAAGRWWVDSNFNFGKDGSSAPVGNLLQIMQQATGKGYGGSYSGKTGVQTGSDGEGGFMATINDGHGGTIGWYSGK